MQKHLYTGLEDQSRILEDIMNYFNKKWRYLWYQTAASRASNMCDKNINFKNMFKGKWFDCMKKMSLDRKINVLMITGVYLPEINGAVLQCSQLINILGKFVN